MLRRFYLLGRLCMRGGRALRSDPLRLCGEMALLSPENTHATTRARESMALLCYLVVRQRHGVKVVPGTVPQERTPLKAGQPAAHRDPDINVP